VINPRNSHTPLPDDRRKRCPICRQTVYSSAGIHPQCAIKQSDPWRPASASPAPAADAEPPTPVAEVVIDAPTPAVAPKRVPAPKRKVKQT
jgi:hypothetical protein